MAHNRFSQFAESERMTTFFSRSSWCMPTGKTSASIVGLARTAESRALQAQSPDILINFDSVSLSVIPLSHSILRGCGLSLLQPRLPALVGLRAAAVIAPLADAFDAAADAAALTLLTRSADVVSGAKAQKARVSLSLARHPHLRPMPSQQRPDVKNSHRRCCYKDRRLTSNSTALSREASENLGH